MAKRVARWENRPSREPSDVLGAERTFLGHRSTRGRPARSMIAAFKPLPAKVDGENHRYGPRTPRALIMSSFPFRFSVSSEAAGGKGGHVAHRIDPRWTPKSGHE